MNNWNKKLIVLAALGAAVCGCASTETSEAYNDPFFPKSDTHVSHRVGRRMAASAARADATLYPMHFHGAYLNSLGEQKLGYVVSDDDTSTPVTVYLAVATDDGAFDARKEAVAVYLAGHGVPADQIRMEAGENPRVSTPTAPLIRNLPKTDSVAEGSAAGTATGGAR